MMFFKQKIGDTTMVLRLESWDSVPQFWKPSVGDWVDKAGTDVGDLSGINGNSGFREIDEDEANVLIGQAA